jgi:hypothetical protein
VIILFKKNKSKKQENNQSQSSIKRVYFEVHNDNKTILCKDDSGITYLGKAVLKNQERKPISIKLYDKGLNKKEVKEYRTLLLMLRNLKLKKDSIFSKKKQENLFLKTNFLKTQTERNIDGEWVVISPYYLKKNYNNVSFPKIPFIEKKKELVWVIINLVENKIYPTNQIILEFLDICTNKPLVFENLIIKDRFIKNKQLNIIINKLTWIASEIKNIQKKESYKDILYNLYDLAIQNTTSKKIKLNLIKQKKL